jgi:hypothetical protein
MDLLHAVNGTTLGRMEATLGRIETLLIAVNEITLARIEGKIDAL